MQHRDIFRSPFASPENFSRFYTVRATSRQHGESPALLDPLVNHFDDIDLADAERALETHGIAFARLD